VTVMQPLAWPSLQNLLEGAALWFGYLAFLFVATKLLPGKRVEGAPLADGARLSYRLNGLTAFLLSCALLCAAQLAGYSLSFVTRHFVSLWIWANVFAFGASAALYLAGRNKPGAKRHGGFLGDYYYGVELNPRLWGVDIKMFSYVPSLAGLWILNASFGFTQLELHGAISQPMLLYLLFTCIYVFNYFQFETGMLYTWDVMSESFGWMLVWGDYAFVPFCYSVAGWYLVDRTEPLPTWALVLLPVLFVFGLWLFRGANSQKDRFKRDPQAPIWGKPPETIGGRILVSGFWGIGRKLNYTGEICVYLSFTLPVGFDSVVPWLLPLWLISLLVHRAWRDEKRCREKYGDLWDQYCRRARFRMLPFVY